MRDASVPASEQHSDHANDTTVPSASDLLRSDVGSNNATVRHNYMKNHNALIANTTVGDSDGTSGTVRDDSIDIGGDFFGRQMSAKGMTSFDMKQFGVETINRYHGGIKATLTNKSMSLDSSLKRSDALTAPKINLSLVIISNYLVFVILSSR